jgi:mannitol/fructose-specific phosphotransferase system IIA component (Ntr-type)
MDEKEVPENVAVTQEEPEGTFPTGPELGLHLMLPHRRSPVGQALKFSVVPTREHCP